LQKAPVQLDDLCQRDTASGQTPVQFLVLLQDSFDSGRKVIARTPEEVHDCGPGQIFGGEAKTLGLDTQPLGLGRREINGALHELTLSWAVVSSNKPLQRTGCAGR
jgi:hypothetical protein